MTHFPTLLKGDRIFDAVALPLLSIMQAMLLAVGIFATREAFTALHGSVEVPPWTIAKLVGSGLGVAMLEVLSRISGERIGQSYANSLRAALYRHLAGMRQSELEARRLGALSLRFVGDLSAARNWFGQGLPHVIATAVILPGATIILWQLDSDLAVTGCSILAMAMVVMATAAFGFERLHEKLRSRRANISIAMIERIAIAPQLDLIGRTPRELDALQRQGVDLRANAVSRAWRTAVLSAIPQIGLAAASVAILWQSASLHVPTGTVAAALSLIALLVMPLHRLAQAWDHFNAWRIARAKALRLFSSYSSNRTTVSQQGPVSASVVGTVNGKDFRLEIAAGSVGYLRGGQLKDRTAIARVLAGLDTSSNISVNYEGYRTSLPRISYIGNRVITLQGSLRRALSLGIEPRPKRGPVFRMALRFGLDTLLSQGKDSLNQRIAESGRSVSPAENLRIDLVRAALDQPNLVIVDTLGLAADSQQQVLVQQLVEETNTTVLIVCHRENSKRTIFYEDQSAEDIPHRSAATLSAE